MLKNNFYDAIVIGSGPNGLAAAIQFAQSGLSVALFEARDTVGGGMRSAELTLPGFTHDVCSAIHPLGVGSPFFRSLPLDQHQLEWIHPSAPLAHPFDEGSALLLERSVEETSKALGADAQAYVRLMEPFTTQWDKLADDVLAPLHVPKHPLLMARFGLLGVRSAVGLAKSRFKEGRTRALFAGLAAHSLLPLDRALTAAFGLILGTLGHAVGWPLPRGGSQKIADALAAHFRSLGGEIFTEISIEHLDALPSSKVILCDTSPKTFLKIAGDRLPPGYKQKLERYRYGPGVFKMDWALSSPIPWKANECLQAGTVHLGGSMEEIASSECQVGKGRHPDKPYLILAQPSLFDPSRAPAGKHTAWGYCHVPNGSAYNMTDPIEAQIERFAPGFKDCILARHSMTTTDLESYNANYVGGDINGGMQDIYQLFTRPAARIVPYSTPVEGLYLCSASTPPGGGVHGMCGYHAARAALKQCFSS